MDKLLEVININKKYPKFQLKDFSFDVEPGQIVGFIGRNGAGKTTTLKGIMNLVHLDSGVINCFDKNLKDNELEAKQNIGFTLSELNYYPNKKVKEMVQVTSKFYKNFDKDRFLHLAKLFNLDPNKKLEELSSGMKVKYSLAIALSYDAKLFILDEPTSGLDPISRDEILDIFEELVKDKTRGILFSTHITSDLDKCATHIVYIHDGEKVYSGNKNDFISSYLFVKGLNLEDSLTSKFIAFKKHDNAYEGLIKSSDRDYFKNYEVSIPSLEDVMVYLERSHRNEEFTL